MRITSHRLLIREFEQRDLLHSLSPPSGGDGSPLQAFDLRRPEAVRRHIKGALEAASEVPRRTWDLAVTIAADGRIIGRAGLQRSLESPGDAMVWFITDPSCWNQGYASEGARAVVDHCFSHHGQHRIWAECDPTNVGAVRLLESLGMRREAHFIENRFFDGTWYDSAVYALLQREWRDQKR